MVHLFLNYPLWSAVLAIILAQFLKIPIYYFMKGIWDFRLFFSTGRMPSSHSSSVAALTTALGLKDGVDSHLFALSVVLSIIVMFDAAGVRRHAGKHAAILNRYLKEYYSELNQQEYPDEKVPPPLEELIGHQPIEVIGGAILGILTALALYWAI
jgi:acid phosphatase family membrane protein YuiD